IFGKGQSVPPPVEEDVPSSESDLGEEADSADDWATRARRALVGGASTGSKRPNRIYGDEMDGPTHYSSAAGCHIITADGDTLVDCTMALGSVALGYAEPQLTRAVIEALAHGSV